MATKRQILLILLMAITTSHGQLIDPTCPPGRHCLTAGCVNRDCQAKLEIESRAGRLPQFTTYGKTGRYVAMAFSLDDKMGSDFSVVCLNGATLMGFWLLGVSAPRNVERIPGTDSGWGAVTLLNNSRNASTCTFNVRFPINLAFRRTMFTATQPYRIFLATGLPNGPDNIARHSAHTTSSFTMVNGVVSNATGPSGNNTRGGGRNAAQPVKNWGPMLFLLPVTILSASGVFA